MILKDYKPKYINIELLPMQTKDFRLSEMAYSVRNKKVIDFESACEEYGKCTILSVCNYDDKEITSIIIYEGENNGVK